MSDRLSGVSARIIVGSDVPVGTGNFTILPNTPILKSEKNWEKPIDKEAEKSGEAEDSFTKSVSQLSSLSDLLHLAPVDVKIKEE